MDNKVFIIKKKMGLIFKKTKYRVCFQEEAAARDQNTGWLNSLEECYSVIDHVRVNGYRVADEVEMHSWGRRQGLILKMLDNLYRSE